MFPQVRAENLLNWGYPETQKVFASENINHPLNQELTKQLKSRYKQQLANNFQMTRPKFKNFKNRKTIEHSIKLKFTMPGIQIKITRHEK